MSLPVVLFDDLELWATGALRAALTARFEPYTDDVYVSNDYPLDPATGEPTRRARMVIVRRDGGPRLDQVREEAQMGINVFGESTQITNDLARMVAALLWASPNGDPVVKVEQIAGLTPIDDPSNSPRVYMTFAITYRGAPPP